MMGDAPTPQEVMAEIERNRQRRIDEAKDLQDELRKAIERQGRK